MSKQSHNTLLNTYIPTISRRVVTNILKRLPKVSLIELVYVWPKQKNTQPQLDKENSSQQQHQLNETVCQYALSLKKDPSKVTKLLLIDKIIYDYWPQGLNILQLSQVDCQLLVDRPNSYSWVLSTVKDSQEKETAIAINPKPFLNKLAQDLGQFYLHYLYVCRHPEYPLVIIRIQLFEFLHPHQNIHHHPHSKINLNSHKPYFIAIPINSPHIIHSPGDDIVTKIMLQAVERNLPQNQRNPYHIVSNPLNSITKSLDSMYILNGSSRFGNSLGAWSAYADGIIDILPLSDGLDHHCITRASKESYTDDNKALVQLKKIANLRFKGTIDGKMKSDKFFDQLGHRQKLKRRRLMYSDVDDDQYHHDEDDNDNENMTVQNQFSSITPSNYAEFMIKEAMGSSNKKSSITVKLTGSDVFAGLHQLSVSTTVEDEMIVNPRTIPSWLTGEEKSCRLTIQDGKVQL